MRNLLEETNDNDLKGNDFGNPKSESSSPHEDEITVGHDTPVPEEESDLNIFNEERPDADGFTPSPIPLLKREQRE